MTLTIALANQAVSVAENPDPSDGLTGAEGQLRAALARLVAGCITRCCSRVEVAGRTRVPSAKPSRSSGPGQTVSAQGCERNPCQYAPRHGIGAPDAVRCTEVRSIGGSVGMGLPSLCSRLGLNLPSLCSRLGLKRPERSSDCHEWGLDGARPRSGWHRNATDPGRIMRSMAVQW